MVLVWKKKGRGKGEETYRERRIGVWVRGVSGVLSVAEKGFHVEGEGSS